jgi:hypothetical protein
MLRIVSSAAAFALLALPAAAAPSRAVFTQAHQVGGAPYRHPGAVGLGAVVSNKLGGTTFFFALDQNGSDAMLDDALSLPSGGLKSAIEAFDSTSGKILKTIKTLDSPTAGHELVVDGIYANDVGLIDEERDSQKFERHDFFYTLDPVSNMTLTGTWTPPHPRDLVLYQTAANQTSQTQVALALQLEFGSGRESKPVLFVTNFANNTIVHRFFLKNGAEQIAQDTATNQAVTSGAVNGFVGPTVGLINLDTGKAFYFAGLNNGPFGAGSVNGLAVDSNSGIAATTTEINAQVEFYNLANGSGIARQLPGTGDSSEFNSGSVVANDPLNRLFVVAQPYSSTASSGSSIDVFDEGGNLIEYINGFNFPNNSAPLNYPTLALVPKLRMGYINGPRSNQIQQFFY